MNSGKIVADGWTGRDGDIEGSTRGPRGPKKTKIRYFKIGLKEMYVFLFLIPFGFVDSPPFDLKSALYAKQSLLLGNRLNVNSSRAANTHPDISDISKVLPSHLMKN